jgi:hypothetical protein
MPSPPRSGILIKVLALLIGLAIGAGVAVLVGSLGSPIQRSDPTPLALRRDYRDEYIRLVALSYQADRDLTTAQGRLALLKPDESAHPLLELIDRWITEGKNRPLITPLVALARDMGMESPLMIEFERQAVP